VPRGSEEPTDIPAAYSMISSARANTVGGMVMSSAFAVFRLITILYLERLFAW
jgi:hypothetical protein